MLEASLRRQGLAGRLHQAQAPALWPQAAGPELARHTRAIEVRDGTLWVAVRSSAWAAQMAFFRSDLLARLNERLGPPGLRGLHFRVGLPREDDAGEAGATAPVRLPPPLPAEVAEVEQAAAQVADPEVRRAWRRVLLSALIRRRRLGG